VDSSVLIVEDDPRIAELVRSNLTAAGFACAVERDGGRAVAAVGRLHPDLIVLDVGLPGIDGIEITRMIRRSSDVPILMLTARTGEGDKVLGFEVGADDYLTKPFSTRELVARVRALLRRSSGAVRTETLTRGDLTIDPGRRAVERGGAPVDLTTLEFDLLFFLAANRGRVYSREDLLERVWGEERVVDARSIDSLVSRLRKKVEPDPGSPLYIQTVWGAGYRFGGLD
jgi:DNA-binding response OmpR family regulator